MLWPFSKKITVIVAPEKRTCVIDFQKSGFEYIVKTLKTRRKTRYAIITDKVIFHLYGKQFKALLQKEKIQAEFFIIPSGEQYKVLKTIEALAEKMLLKGITRSETLIAWGGGVIGDLTGLLASLYMRGIKLIHIPTTLLAMVDSSIGGKTGVDLRLGKNLLGTFHQPEMILINPYFIEHLPKSQLVNGLAEVIKYGIIADKRLFKILERKKEEILKLKLSVLNKILIRSVKIKLNIVSKDEREKTLRMLLNYGHTVGHALEKISNFRLHHGQAIAIGMVQENNWAIKKGILKAKDAERIKKLIELYGLPTEIPKNMKWSEIQKVMYLDKKRKGKTLYLCVPKKIGKALIIEHH